MTKETITKWGLVVAAVLVGGHYVLPLLLTMALTATKLALLMIAGLGLAYLLPAIAETFAQLGGMAWAGAIGFSPVTRLERDVSAHARQIEELESRIASATAEVVNLETMLRESSHDLSEDQLSQWQRDLDSLKMIGRELISLRDTELGRHREFVGRVRMARAQYRMGSAFKKAIGASAFAKRSGPDSKGSEIAFDEVRRQLSESQARISLALTRPQYQLVSKRNIQEGGEKT